MYRFFLHSFGGFDAAHPIGPSCWPHFDLFVVHEGQVALRFDGAGEIRVAAGGAVLIHPHTAFRGEALSDEARASVQHFLFDDGQRDRLPRSLQDLPPKVHGFEHRHLADPRFLADVSRAVEWAGQDAEPSDRQLRETLHTLILLQFREHAAGGRKRHLAATDLIGAATRWARDRMPGCVTVEELAATAGLSPAHFRARFKVEMGLSPGAFLRNLRLNEGKRLLRETRLPIKEIARVLAYSDLVAFNRAFRNNYHITPARYRNEATPKG